MSPVGTGLFNTNPVDGLLGKSPTVSYPSSPVSEGALGKDTDPVQKMIDDKDKTNIDSDILSETLGQIKPFTPQKLNGQSPRNMSIPNMSTTFEEMFAPRENRLPGDKYKSYNTRFNPYRSSANQKKLINTSILGRSFI